MLQIVASMGLRTSWPACAGTNTLLEPTLACLILLWAVVKLWQYPREGDAGQGRHSDIKVSCGAIQLHGLRNQIFIITLTSLVNGTATRDNGQQSLINSEYCMVPIIS